jgi:putative DNA primase/helicase
MQTGKSRGCYRQAGPTDGKVVHLQPGTSIEPQAVRWLWPQWLARGKLHILAGAPGTGKTTIALSLAALVSAGGRWPDSEAEGPPAEPADVLIWSGEDGIGDTLLPRLLAAGGAASRVHFVAGASRGGERLPFDPAADMPEFVEAALGLPRLGLMILDPVVAAVGGSSRDNAGARRGLQGIAEIAARLDCAVLGITHFSKNSRGQEPLDRVTGSVAFGAVARSVLATARPADPEMPLRLVRAKANLGGDNGGIEYRLRLARVPGRDFDAQLIEWGRPVEGSARDLLAIERLDDQVGTLVGAERFLRELLAEGAVLVWRIRTAANAHGYSWRTLQRAKQRLDIRAVKTGLGGGRWAWQLPAKVA